MYSEKYFGSAPRATVHWLCVRVKIPLRKGFSQRFFPLDRKTRASHRDNKKPTAGSETLRRLVGSRHLSRPGRWPRIRPRVAVPTEPMKVTAMGRNGLNQL